MNDTCPNPECGSDQQNVRYHGCRNAWHGGAFIAGTAPIGAETAPTDTERLDWCFRHWLCVTANPTGVHPLDYDLNNREDLDDLISRDKSSGRVAPDPKETP